MRNFPPAFFLFFFLFFVFYALASTNCICLPFHPSSFCLLFRLFPHFLYPHRPKDFFFSFFSLAFFFYYINYEVLSSVMQQSKRSQKNEEKKKKEKLSLLLPLSLYAFIIDRFFLLCM